MIEKDAVYRDFKKQVLGYGLTTAEIVYRRPDRHWLLPASLTTFLDGPVMSDTAQTGENFQLQNCSMGQSKRPTCPECGGYLTLAPPPDGKGPRTLQCLECDRPDPIKTEKIIGWLNGELKPPN